MKKGQISFQARETIIINGECFIKVNKWSKYLPFLGRYYPLELSRSDLKAIATIEDYLNFLLEIVWVLPYDVEEYKTYKNTERMVEDLSGRLEVLRYYDIDERRIEAVKKIGIFSLKWNNWGGFIKSL